MADCIFCKIVSGAIPSKLVKKTPDMVAFHDVNPQAPVHVLVIPTHHVASLRDAKGPDGEKLLGRLLAFAAEVATELGLDAKGYRLVVNTGADGGQTVFHVHLHLMGGRRMTWPPG